MCWGEEGDHNVFKKFASRKCEGDIREAVDQDEMSCNEVETVR